MKNAKALAPRCWSCCDSASFAHGRCSVAASPSAPLLWPATDYWPSAETFSTGEDIFEVPFSVAGPDWEAWLHTLTDLLNGYLADGSRSDVLRNSKGVGMGFVDGDMHVLWQRDAKG